tara:strand:+ start:589 stop:2235 length:1647 start_codon:yes stop_codon:yes gene_type:complete
LTEKLQNLSNTGLYSKNRFSRLTLRILAINSVAIAILIAGFLYLDRYESSLIQSELEALEHQADLFSDAIGEVAVRSNYGTSSSLSRTLVRRIVTKSGNETPTRSRVFDAKGRLLADSMSLPGAVGNVEMKPLEPLSPNLFFRAFAESFYEQVFGLLRQRPFPMYRESTLQLASAFPEVVQAMKGTTLKTVRATEKGSLILTVAVPIQKYKRVLGVLLLSLEGKKIDEAVRSFRLEMFGVFLLTISITVALSVYLARSITLPIQRLASIAEQIRNDRGRHYTMPDFSERNDEIGELGKAIKQMTDNLWQRLDAIERFAADVSHEIKNPLTSIRSAVETAAKVTDSGKRDRLLAVILDDVHRLDRLISDISDSSRLDAELSRETFTKIDIKKLLQTFHEMTTSDRRPNIPFLMLNIADNEASHVVQGHENRLVQVIQNLVTNAVTFSPIGGTITIHCESDEFNVTIMIDDEGPGIPNSKLTAIFDRFYTERPTDEKFGMHSGLGLSICKQIIDAHRGQIWAQNLLNDLDEIKGARFIIKLAKENHSRTR